MDPQTLTSLITEWKEMDDQIKEANKALRGLKQEEKKRRDIIIEYLIKNDIGTCNLGGSQKLHCVKTDRKQGINKDYLLKTVVDFVTSSFNNADFNNLSQDEKAAAIVQHILENRESKSSYNLKVSKK